MRPVLTVLFALLLTVAGTVTAVNRGASNFADSALAASTTFSVREDQPAAAAHPPTPDASAVAPSSSAPPMIDLTLAGPPTSAQLQRGARTYRTLCLACHLPDGKGMAGLTPPLAGADYLFADRERAIHTVLKGLAGPIIVNGQEYRGVMPALEHVLTDPQVADVLTYVFNAWGNAGEAFDPAHIARRRAEWSNQPGVVVPPAPAT